MIAFGKNGSWCGSPGTNSGTFRFINGALRTLLRCPNPIADYTNLIPNRPYPVPNRPHSISDHPNPVSCVPKQKI